MRACVCVCVCVHVCVYQEKSALAGADEHAARHPPCSLSLARMGQLQVLMSMPLVIIGQLQVLMSMPLVTHPALSLSRAWASCRC